MRAMRTGFPSRLLTRVANACFALSLTLLIAGPARAELAETDPVLVSPDFYAVLFENEHQRVVKYTLKPGEMDNPHTHPPKYMYVLEGGWLEINPEGAESFVTEEKTGHGTWSPARGLHTAKNVGKTTVRILLIEPKSAH